MSDAAMRYVKNGEFAFREIVGEAVLVPIRSGVGDLSSIYTMNEVGAAIWSLIDSRPTAAEIASRLCEEFDVGPEKAAGDVEAFLRALCDKGLIRPEAGA